MVDGGFAMPKPLIMVGDRHIIDYSMGSLRTTDCNTIFVVRRDHVCNYAIDEVLKKKFGDVQIFVAEKDTRGSIESVLVAKDAIDNDDPLIVFCPDIYFEPKFVPADEMFVDDGFILTFKANSANYSYVQSEKGLVTKTAEKIVISNDASVGVYCFATGRLFIDAAQEAMSGDQPGELYVCPLYNRIIEDGGKVRTASVPILYVMGTPSEMAFFKEVVFPYFLPRKFILCCDHSGFEMKEHAKAYLEISKADFVDCGCYVGKDCDYSDYVSQAIEMRRYFPGAVILGFCRSGQGVNIFANKTPGIRSVLVSTKEAASLGIAHNAANFFAVPSGTVKPKDLPGIIEAIASTKFEGGRHQNRLQRATA